MSLEKEQKEIEAAFITSWDEAEHFYNLELFTLELAWVRHILPLIKVLRERGYDRQLRAKSRGVGIRLSRSRKPLLALEQPFLDFDVLEQGGMRVRFDTWHSLVTFDVDKVEITPEIENLLIALMAYPLDHGED